MTSRTSFKLGISILLSQFHCLNGYHRPPYDGWPEAYAASFASLPEGIEHQRNHLQDWPYAPELTNNVHQTTHPNWGYQNHVEQQNLEQTWQIHGSTSHYGSPAEHNLAPLPDELTDYHHSPPKWPVFSPEDIWRNFPDEHQSLDLAWQSPTSTSPYGFSNEHNVAPLPDQSMDHQYSQPEWPATSSQSHLSDSSNSNQFQDQFSNFNEIPMEYFGWLYTLEQDKSHNLDNLRIPNAAGIFSTQPQTEAWKELVKEVCKRNRAFLFRLSSARFQAGWATEDIEEAEKSLLNWLDQQLHSLSRNIVDHIKDVTTTNGTAQDACVLLPKKSKRRLLVRVNALQARLTKDAFRLLGDY